MFDHCTLRKLWLSWFKILFCRSWQNTCKASWDRRKPGRILAVAQKGQELTKGTLRWHAPRSPPLIMCMSSFNEHRSHKETGFLNVCAWKGWHFFFSLYPISIFRSTYIPCNTLFLNIPNPNPLGKQIWEIFSHLFAWYPAIKPFLSPTKLVSEFGLLYIGQWTLARQQLPQW